MRRFRVQVVLVIALVLTNIFAQAAVAQVALPNITSALAKDAEWYASDNGVSLDEAIRRLQLQSSVGDLDAQLSEKEQGTFAGLWIQHKPEFRIIAQFTHNGQTTIQPYIAQGPLAGLVEVQPADLPLVELRARQMATLKMLRALGIRFDSGIDVLQNHVEVYVPDPAQLTNSLQKANKQLPDKVNVVRVPKLAEPSANIYGGLSLSPDCTIGFSVLQPSTGTKGIATAAHCPNAMSFNGQSLTLKGELQSGSNDSQWHTTPNYTPINFVEDGVGGRSITSQTIWSNQPINGTVCKYGRTTGRTCGYIIQKDISLSYVTGSNATFIRVHNAGVNEAAGGDSGGPVFFGNSAYGILSGTLTYSGQSEVDLSYMAVSYLSNHGITVLTQ
jgi:hypothetical protein